MCPNVRLANGARGAHIIALLALISILAPSTFAQVRRATTYSTFINPTPTARTTAIFSARGFAAITGGVMFDAAADFHLESEGTSERIDPASLTLTIDRSGVVGIDRTSWWVHVGSYTLPLHRGLACPLGQFTQREGRVAFTLPPETDADAFGRLKEAGTVPVSKQTVRTLAPKWIDDGDLPDMFVAREFAGTPFVSLLYRADFAEVEELPTALKASLMSSINAASGNGDPIAVGSYINTDSQTTYQVHLVAERSSGIFSYFTEGRTEMSGVPLRYSWNYRDDQSAEIDDIEVLSQDWPANARLSRLTGASAPTQYDVVALFQAAGVFKQLHITNPNAFGTFVEAACAR